MPRQFRGHHNVSLAQQPANQRRVIQSVRKVPVDEEDGSDWTRFLILFGPAGRKEQMRRHALISKWKPPRLMARAKHARSTSAIAAPRYRYERGS